jgi:transposase
MDIYVQQLFEVVEKKVGKRFVKQVFCVLLIIFGIESKVIFERLGVSLSTQRKYNKLIQNKNIKDIFEDNVYRQKSELEDFKDQIVDALEKEPPQTLREASVIIEKVSGIKRSLPRIRSFLKKTVINI